MLDLRRIAKKLVTPFRQYLGRLTVADRHLRGAGLEIGALQDPMPMPKGTRVRYVDIAPTEQLRAMYPAKTRRWLVDVDVVDDGEKLATVADDSQDFVASNHFFEHAEDPIGALRNMLRVVRPGGVVYMSVPDKRLTFDHARPATTVEHVVRDHEDGPEGSRHGHYEEVVKHTSTLTEPAAIAARVAELEAQDFRIHFHCWSQTEFLELLCALQRRPGFPPFDVAEFVANQCEMIVVLRKRS
ncbi:MAG: methyltransferase domain-containing protein [Planctomycetes bacterium]|nr:methyltransferase domain-containing protein [Planctomycetota bacterium]